MAIELISDEDVLNWVATYDPYRYNIPAHYGGSNESVFIEAETKYPLREQAKTRLRKLGYE